MKSSPLESKTVRPGLMVYSFYRSDRHPLGRGQSKSPKKAAAARRGLPKLRLLLVMLAIIGVIAAMNKAHSSPSPNASSAASGVAAASAQCQSNTLDKHIVVSISQRHAWACQASRAVYNSPVITGIEKFDATRTPPGTYHIYAKQMNITLSGSDAAGSWNDPVYYWMPFLDNQHGTYGFHDATWRPDSAFGNVDPSSSDASHGCVELPLAASKWLYDWAAVGTTVTIES